MSGIHIAGMEMPKNCTDCFACHILSDDGLYCEPLDTDIEPGSFDRLDNCPLVPVPEHGRLIDADALLNNKGVGTLIAGFGKMYHETAIEYAPTIIPADPAEDDANG